MSDRELKAIISATDKASPVFKQVADGATKMGTSVETASKRGSTSLRDMGKASNDLKIGAAALATSFTFAARASQDQSRQIDAINRLYGESADQILQLSEAIQDNTNFSNDAARQAAITGATLASNYALTADQIGTLIERSANLAQIHGIDLADAMTRVSGAIRGEGEAAELLGLNMSDSAVASAAAAAGLEGWTTTMTEAEKAAFRYSLVLQQTEATQGAAADAADTTAGRVRELADTVQDAAQSFAGWTGPIGQGAAVLSDYALQAGIALGGVVKLGEGLKAMGLASKAASIALSPAGLIGIAAGATIGIIALADALTHGYDEAAQDAKIATDELGASIKALMSQGSERAILGAEWQTQIEAALAGVLAVETRLAEIDVAKNTLLRVPPLDEADADRIWAEVAALEAEEAQLRALAESFGGTTQAADEFAQTQDALNAILTNTGVGSQLAIETATLLFAAYERGEISLQQLMDALQAAAAGLSEFDRSAIDAAAAAKQAGTETAGLAREQAKAAETTTALSEAMKSLDTGYADTAEGAKVLADIQLIAEQGTEAQKVRIQELFKAYEAGTDVTNTFLNTVKLEALLLRQQAEARDKATAAMVRQEAAAYSMADAAKTFTTATKEQTAAQAAAEAKMVALEGAAYSMAGAQQAASGAVADHNAELQAATDAAIAFIGAEENIIDVLLRSRSLRGNQNNLENVDALLNSQAGIEAVFGTIVGGTEAIGQTVEQLDKWATDLNKVVDGQSVLNDLRERGVITENQYNRALEATTRINATNVAIQDDLLSIQARQAPFIEEQTRAYADQIDALADLSVKQQRIELGFIDQGERAKVASSYATAYSASLGEIPEDVATKIIVSDAEADPILKEVLLEYGLIEEGADGKITVNFDDAPTLTSAVQGLTGAVENLTAALLSVPSEVNTNITVSGVQPALEAAAQVGSALNSIPRSVNSTVTTTQQTITIGEPGGYLGGVASSLPSYAMGGLVTANLAEVGPELLTFQNGGSALVANPGVYTIPSSTYVHTADATRGKLGQMGGGPTFNITVQGNINGFDGVDEVMDAFKIAAREHFAGWR